MMKARDYMGLGNGSLAVVRSLGATGESTKAPVDTAILDFLGHWAALLKKAK
jgi:hypothetical protein